MEEASDNWPGNDPIDPILQFDWAAHWARLVRDARRPARGRARDAEGFAESYAFGLTDNPDLLLEVVAPFLSPEKTVIDVGAGTGRHVVSLASRVCHITAVEPSAGMRGHIPVLPNVTLVPITWQQAQVDPADLVICSHVLYAIEDIVPFIEKMERCALEGVFVYLRDGPHGHPSDLLYTYLTGKAAPRRPQLSDLFNLLRQRGRVVNLVMSRDPWRHHYVSLDMAVAVCRDRLGDVWNEELGRKWLEDHLIPQQDGSLVYERPPIPEGVLHWSGSA